MNAKKDSPRQINTALKSNVMKEHKKIITAEGWQKKLEKERGQTKQ